MVVRLDMFRPTSVFARIMFRVSLHRYLLRTCTVDRPTQRAGNKLFERFQPKLKVRPFRQQVGHGSNRGGVHTNRTAYTGRDTARFFARPPTTLSLPTPTPTCFGADVFKKGCDGTVDVDDSPSIDEILRILHRLEEDSKTPTNTSIKRRRRLGQIAVPPWKRRSVPPPDAVRMPEETMKDLVTPETKPCIVSLEKVGGTTASISGDALNVPSTVAAAAGGTMIKPTPTKKAHHHKASALLARRKIKTEEDSMEPQQQPRARMGAGASAAAPSSVGEGAPYPPSVKIFDTVVVKQLCEVDNRLAWRRPSSPNANETKPRRSASGPPCAGGFVADRRAGRVPKAERRNDDPRCVRPPSHRRAGGAPKAERRSDDDLRRIGGAAHGRVGGSPKAESRSGDVLRETAGSVVRPIVKELPVAAADRSVEVDRCRGRCERSSGKCDRRRPDAAVVGEPSVTNRESKPPLPPPLPGHVAVIATGSSTEYSPAESSPAESSRTEWSWTKRSCTESSPWTGLASCRLPLEHNENNDNDGNEQEEGEVLEVVRSVHTADSCLR